ncbi:atos homolog protein A-like isoform X1 [Argiope bruennichi]|uniref:atos homolog protein A-like isoform X1 n=1 Tax=Argiope bruennichi TaxID=94029 RepID=UPI0024953C96|nr:atos homolog protein A-like isoform X1 [Argiope bruennichi]
MKHSVSGDSMTEVLEPKVVIPCSVKCESVLQKLYIDLCNLIVESRIPRFNEKGYGDGIHCPPLLGRNTHGCDLSKPECQKHQRLIQQLFRAVGNNVFEIEVLVLPDCCTESKLKERIQSREYRLLEKWSLKCIYSKESMKSTPVDVPQLLRAVRSFLHFSQLSAWLSSTKGKSPSNVYYWVKSSSDGLSTKFEHEPEEHSFPVCKVAEDFYGSVKVKYPPRTQYVPIIPCSKHPPLHKYSVRTICENPSLQQNISLNSQVVRQLHKSPCDDQLGVLSENGCGSEPTSVLLAPTILKTFTGNISDGNRVLKQSFCPDSLVDASNLSFELKQSKNIDLLSKSQTSYLCNYAETYSNGLSQENVCFDTSQLIRHLRKKKFKIKRINGDENSKSSDDNKCHQSPRRHSVELMPLPPSNSHVNVSSPNTVVKKCEASPVYEAYHRRKLEQKKRPSKRRVLHTDSEKSAAIPPKKVCCDKYLSQDYQISLNSLNEIFPQRNEESSQVSCNIPVISTSVNLNIENGNLEPESFINQEIQTLLPNASNEADSRLSEYFSRSTPKTYAKSETTNQKNCRKRKCLTKLTVKEENMGVDKDTNSSEIRACSATSVVDTDNENELKKVKLMDDCANDFSFPASCCTNLITHFDKPVYNPALNFKKSEEKYVCRKRLLRTSSDLIKDQISSPSNYRISPSEKQNFSSSLQTDSKNNALSQKNELQILKARLLSIRKEKNRRLEAKLLKRYNKVFAAKCRENSCETTFVDCKESNSEYKNCNRTHLNSSKCGLREKKLNNLAKKITKIKTTLKGPKEEEILMNTSEPVETKSLEISLFTTVNKPHRITKRRKYKSSKKLFNSTSCNISPSSQPYKVKNSPETVCTSDSCQCQESQPQSRLPKRISPSSTVPATILSPKASLVVSSEVERNCSINHVYQSKDSLGPSEISLPSERHCDFVLNRLVPSERRNVSYEKSNENLELFSKSIPSFPKGRKLLANFEESILKGCLPTLSSVEGFRAEIGASGSFFPSHLTLPANVSFFELGNSHQGTAPYVAHVILGDAEYFLPKKGAVQVTLFNPSETVVKMFVLNYDLSSMPPMCHTFIRQKIYYLPVGSTDEHPSSPKWLRFIIHLRFASSKTGKIFLHKDFKIVVLNKSNDDAASEFNQEPRELRSFVSVPRNPTFSNF